MLVCIRSNFFGWGIYSPVCRCCVFWNLCTNNLRYGYRGGPGYDGGHGKREALHSMADLLFTAKTRFPHSKIFLNSILVRKDIGYKALYDFNCQLDFKFWCSLCWSQLLGRQGGSRPRRGSPQPARCSPSQYLVHEGLVWWLAGQWWDFWTNFFCFCLTPVSQLVSVKWLSSNLLLLLLTQVLLLRRKTSWEGGRGN